MQPHEAVSRALARPRGPAPGPAPRPGPAIVAFLTAGHPDPARFRAALDALAETADAVEIGVPFSDPMADGITVQRSSRAAIEHGVSLRWIFDELARRGARGRGAPLLLMSYLNPLLAFGYGALAARAVEAGVSGFIVPDLPFEESEPLAGPLAAAGLALVQLVTPATPAQRLARLCAASTGFVYAVTRTGTTGAGALPAELEAYLDRVAAASTVPVCAGFGVRTAEQVALIGRHADGVVVGSALVELLERDGDPAAFIRELRGQPPQDER